MKDKEYKYGGNLEVKKILLIKPNSGGGPLPGKINKY